MLKDGLIVLGFLNFKNKHTYQGPFLNGKKHGRGVYTWPDGDTFVGILIMEFILKEFTNGEMVISILGNLNPSSKIQEKYTINMAWVFSKIK